MVKLGPCILGKKGMVIEKWEKSFSPKTKNFNLIPTWVSLLRLHPSCWHPSVIIGVIKVISTLVTIKRATRLKLKLIDYRFIVNLDITKSLMKEIRFKVEYGREWIQPIVYENFPIQCNICKSFDYYAKDCPEKKIKHEERRTKER